MKNLSLITLILTSIHLSLAAQEIPPLAEERIGIIEQLPSHYPDNWIFAQKDGFPLSGQVMIIDVTAANNNYKGSIGVGYTSDMMTNNKLGELYVAETYYDRGARGKRNDMITIYDQASLKVKGEIELEEGKRFLVSAMDAKFQLTNDKKWALIANYTPATSITVVDLETRKILNDIDIPGCTLSYPLGDRGFATMCGYGEFISINLDENAQPISEHQSATFNDLDNDPHYVKYATVGDVSYFPTFMGHITGVDMSGEQVSIGETWSLLSDEERASGWRPGGWQLLSADKNGLLYIIMHENGFNGSHKDAGTEVWVFDPASTTRVAIHKLKEKSRTILVTREETPHLVVARDNEPYLDIYDAASGEFRRVIEIGVPASTLATAQ